MKEYKPELGQFAFGSWLPKDIPEYIQALLMFLLKEFERIGHNIHGWHQEDYEELTMAGVEYRPYYWGNDEEEQCKPNFKFEDIMISWYKHPGRGMSTNRKCPLNSGHFDPVDI